MKSEFALAFNEVVEDKQLSRDVILEALESDPSPETAAAARAALRRIEEVQKFQIKRLRQPR